MINKYLNQLETHLKSIDIFADYSFSYKIDQDAGTLKIWINATFQGDSRFDGFEFVVFTKDSFHKNKYRYNFIVNNRVVRWDNAPHHSDIKTFPHHLHIDSKVFNSQEPTLEYVLRYIKKFL
ncbi:toxin-antitoxin system TumE family protein [Candidatus Hodarchaeum mangrovi]